MVVRRVVGGVLVVVGGVWLLQGLNLLGGSSMTGHAFWAVVGAPMVVIGVVLFRSTSRSRDSVDPE